MTLMRMQFAGQIKKADHKNINGKALVEISICKKQKGRNGAEDTFTWIRIGLWEPAEWMLPRLVKGNFIAGSGEFTSRSYDSKGVKQTSLEVRCSSFDIEVEAISGQAAAPAPAPVPVRDAVPAPAVAGEDEPPW